ncbi:MAG: virulence RhuM family protein [Candidatus Cloacimonetes bacterium]|nr:virulence RhuM family protein [Candidatus Cloacimonadota bacterium]
MPKPKTQLIKTTEGSDSAKGQFLVYQAEDGRLKIDVRLEGETVWLTQAMMAELFQTTQQNISQHVLNIYEEGELAPESTHKKFLSVRHEGNREVKRVLDYYNLDMIISVGYRVKSHVATRFRIWATQQLTEFIKKGFLLDDDRLKNPDLPFDNFEELERRIQNKMHWAITGKTAAEIIHSALNNLVEQYLIFAQGQAMRRIPMHMQDWIKKLDGFLNINDRDILNHAGKISHEIAKQLAEGEYEKYQATRLQNMTEAESDFEQAIKQIEVSKPKSGTNGS